MSKNIKLLDCTLRDGGYLVDCQFGTEFIKGFTESLTQSGVDVIEVGFLKDEPHREGNTVYNNAAQIIPYLPKNKPAGVSYVVLSDFSRYHIENLDPCDGRSIDGIRACFFKKERKAVISFCKRILEQGYKLYVQPVDVLGYSEDELLDLINDVNELEPETFSMVDTFGSMFPEDLEHLFELVHSHLSPKVRMGFHSHNNMQMSFALSQTFLRLAANRRCVTVDSTLCGMGRGAGNTNTELMASYLDRKYDACYNMDILLDAVDNYMGSMRAKCTWGYSVPYFLAGVYSAHVHNITYLSEKPSIQTKDMRFVLEQLPADIRKRYDYDLVDKLYADRLASLRDDSCDYEKLRKHVNGRNLLLFFPGPSGKQFFNEVCNYAKQNNCVVISVNQPAPDGLPGNISFFSNPKRHDYWKHSEKYNSTVHLLTSNLDGKQTEDDMIVNIAPLLRPGLRSADNAAVLLLTLLDQCAPASIAIAGLDGYDSGSRNFARENMERPMEQERADALNNGLQDALFDIKAHHKGVLPQFITPGKFNHIFHED